VNILIIGGAGYIGSHVAREFLDAGHKVTVFDNLSSGLKENLFADALFVQGDILNPPELASANKFSFSPLDRLSNTVTLCPASKNSRATWLPM
jgi:UDP-glucose 4-epimerase